MKESAIETVAYSMAMIYFFAKPILPPGVTENRTHSQKRQKGMDAEKGK